MKDVASFAGLSRSNCSSALCAWSFMFAHNSVKQTHISYRAFCAVRVWADSGFGHIMKVCWRQWLGLKSPYGRTVVGGSLCVWGLIHLHGNPSIQVSNERPPLHARQAAPRSIFWSYVTFSDISPTTCWLHILSTLHVAKDRTRGNGKRGCWEVWGPEHSVLMSQDPKGHAFQSHRDTKIMVLLLKQGFPWSCTGTGVPILGPCDMSSANTLSSLQLSSGGVGRECRLDQC